VANGKPLRTLRGHYGDVLSASFSPDARWIATAGPTAVGLWSAASGELLSFLQGPESTLTGVSFAPAGHRVLVSSTDGAVRTYLCELCGRLPKLAALARSRLARAHGR
jgi:WD40 repeat protein